MIEYIRPVFTIFSFLLSICLAISAFKRWEKQQKAGHKFALEKEEFKAQLSAYQKAWSLLQYMSEKENDKSVFVSRGSSTDRRYILRTKQGKEYINQLANLFYGEAVGLFLDNKSRDLLYDFRKKIRTVLDANEGEKRNQEEIIVTSKRLKDEIHKIRAQINTELRTQYDQPIQFKEKDKQKS